MLKVGERAEKIVPVEKDGDWIIVSTASADRDNDRIMTEGGDLSSYLKNPVVLWGHNYWDPWATIGVSIEYSIEPGVLKFRPDFRKPTSPYDPMTIIKSLWEGNYVKTASIGFIPLELEENEFGGFDITRWELLEWSLVPVPANQEALRLMAKALADPRFELGGRVVSDRTTKDGVREITDFETTHLSLMVPTAAAVTSMSNEWEKGGIAVTMATDRGTTLYTLYYKDAGIDGGEEPFVADTQPEEMSDEGNDQPHDEETVDVSDGDNDGNNEHTLTPELVAALSAFIDAINPYLIEESENE